jgi:MYXO-CTERM domain-containing protein
MRTIPLFIWVMLLLALAWSAHIDVDANAQANPGLAKLEIDIWPEFDRAATLVILRGELAPEVTLPASVSLRIPTSSDGPTALANAASADAPLLTIPYERSEVQVDFLTLTFKTETRFFQMEYYDLLKTASASRSYTYVWTGDLAVGQLSVQVQEPAGATALSVQPDLGPDVAGPNGLVYHEADLGALEQGKSLTVDVAYQKSDPRTSAEILGLTTSAPESGTSDSDGGLPWLIIAVVAGALVLAAAVLVRRRTS